MTNNSIKESIKVAIACQGGGAQTAFTAGALAYLLTEFANAKQQGEHPQFEIVALSGTSGGAVCASLAWWDLVLERIGSKKPDELKVSCFWRTGYPEGNAALPYLSAWMEDWKAFWTEGRLPWLHTVDRLRAEAAVAMYQEPEYTDFMPVIFGVESNPYFFKHAFAAIDAMVPPPMKVILDMTQQVVRSLPKDSKNSVFWIRNFIGDMLDLLPFHEESTLNKDEQATIRREFDVQDAFRALLKKYFKPEEVKEIKEKLAKGAFIPELLIGAVDAQHTHALAWGEGKKHRSFEPKPKEKLFRDLKEVIDIEESDLEPHTIHRVDRTNYKAFCGTQNLSRLVDCIISSAAIPTVMRGVEIDGSTHWDGLFSCNPPMLDLPSIHLEFNEKEGKYDDKQCPSEIWVIRINPMDISDRPDTPREIIDRRNELAGNLSMLQEIQAIKSMNGVIKGQRFYKPISFGFIDMDERIAEELDYPTKLDRRLEYVEKLMKNGHQQAESFLRRWRSKETRHFEVDKKAIEAEDKLRDVANEPELVEVAGQ